ncbi:MAG: DUF4886 domain-containing protein [Clostridia bacterium]|nr:DUF4886 domain-containing protein [Clostridia bacterium]
MKRRLLFIASLVFVICCIFAISVNAACQGGCTDSWTVSEGSESYLDSIIATNKCSVCGTTIAEKTINPLFITVGYSYSEYNGGIVQHYAVDKESVALYTEITGKSVIYGAIISSQDAIGNDCPIDANGAPTKDGVYVTNLTNKDIAVFDVMINDIPEDARSSVKLVCSAFVVIDGVVSYIDNGEKQENPVANSYDDVVKAADSWGKEEEEEKVNSLKILTIGNSFSDDAMEYVYKIAKEAGVKYVELGNLRANNCTLATHVSNAQSNSKAYMFRYWADGATTWHDTGTWDHGAYTMYDAIKKADWDYIVFQQASSDSGTASTYDSLSDLISYVDAHKTNPNVKYAWQITWSARADYSSQIPAFSKILAAVNAKITTNSKISVVIPSGTAIENAKTSYLTPKNIQRDAKHLSYGIGRYIAGLTFVKVLTGLPIDNATYPLVDTEGHSLTNGTDTQKMGFEFSEEVNKICIESVNNAIEKPYEVTNSQYTTKN